MHSILHTEYFKVEERKQLHQ